MDMTCNQVRSKIRAYINSGEMKVGEFQDKLGVSSNSYLRFMGQNGVNKGAESATYVAGWLFFKKREMAGLKMPKKKKAKTADNDKGGKEANDKDNPADKGSKKDAAEEYDVSSIHLDGEEEGKVPIFDTCDEIRRKINAHLRASDMSQAAFVREIAKTLPDNSKVTSRQMTAFLGKKGPLKGSDSPACYAAYVWFEKLRIKNGKKKGKKREEMECEWPETGMIRVPTQLWLHCRSDERPTVDKYGHVERVSIR